jgi:MFS family permease
MSIGSPEEIAVIYTAAVIQGVALVTFPAASAVFTSASEYGLSNTDCGAMFVPQAITAIGSALAGAGLTRSFGAKRICLSGLGAKLLAMTLLIVSEFVMHAHLLAFSILLAARASMGVGFGFTVPALNTFAAGFFPRKVDKAVLGLNALLGLGTALAPVFIAIFVGAGHLVGLAGVGERAACGAAVIQRPSAPRARRGGPCGAGREKQNPAAQAILGVCDVRAALRYL